MSKAYFFRMFFHLAVFIGALLIYIYAPGQYDLFLNHFFSSFTPLHLVWIYLLVEMAAQSLPLPFMPTGCMKQFRFRSGYSNDVEAAITAKKENCSKELRSYIRNQNIRALIVMVLWFLANSIWWILYLNGWISAAVCILGSVLYTVFDMICILIVCPFQLIFMDTKCCSTCRIFNYGQIFTVTPFLLVPTFPTISLVVIAVIILIRWEYAWTRYPERFFAKTNPSLSCTNCTEKLCHSRNEFYRLSGISKLRYKIKKQLKQRIHGTGSKSEHIKQE